MSSPNLGTPPAPPSSTRKPLIIAAYRYGDPSRKRRVKVPPDTPWPEFLALLYSRLEIDRDLAIEICDENDIGIVSVDDLVDNEVLVVKERQSLDGGKAQWGYGGGSVGRYGGGRDAPPDPYRRSHDQALPTTAHMMPISKLSRSRVGGESAASSVIVGAPQLSHFIQCNSFGYYFLAEADNVRLAQSQGKARKAHCIVKVPYQQDTLRTIESEASLLHRISHHKSIISPPNIHIINFSDDFHQRFFYSLSQQKQGMLRQIVGVGVALQGYVYPLYGVTMATKIKSGLSPERVLKYVYQLVDVMHYLQQRGVIHQNLLPENIQVMSNDRVIVCNFETAIQTDPNTCLMVVSGAVAPPSNCTGLSPEVLSAFARLRVESETIDYSTQYPWMFGVLSVVVATGTHPLLDYPFKFRTEGQKIRYRSHHIQALPNPEKYPPVFMKLVKRSMSCDPVRRPSLLQILTVLKRDSRILSLMTGNRLPNEKGRRGSTGGVASSDHPLVSPQRSKANIQQQHYPASEQVYYEPPPPGPPVLPAPINVAFPSGHPLPTSSHQRVNRLRLSKETSLGFSRSQDHIRSHDSHVTTTPSSMDPFHSLNRSWQQQQQQLSAVDRRDAWCTFGEATPTQTTPTSTTRMKSATVATIVPLADTATRHSLKRYGSTGAFSDNFMLSHSSNQNLSTVRGRSGRLSASSEQLSRSYPDRRRIFLGRSFDALTARTSASSEGDLKNLHEFQYHRLTHSSAAASSQEISPGIRRTGGDLERLINPSSPEPENTEGVLENTGRGGQYSLGHQNLDGSGIQRDQTALRQPIVMSEGGAELPASDTGRNPRENSLSSLTRLENPWRDDTSTRQDVSSCPPSLARLDNPQQDGSSGQSVKQNGSSGHSVRQDGSSGHSVRQDASSSPPSLARLGNLSADIFQQIPMLQGNSWVEGSGDQSHDGHVRSSSGALTGNDATNDNKMSLLRDLVDPASSGVGSNQDAPHGEDNRVDESIAATFATNLRSSTSDWPDGQEGVFAGKEGMTAGQEDVGMAPAVQRTADVNRVTPSPTQDLNVFPKALDSQTNLLDELTGDSTGMLMGYSPPNTSIASAHLSNPHTSPAGTATSRGYSPLMSPLPEASQEVTNSMSQPTEAGRFPEDAHQSASPSSRTGFTARQQASPFRHAALSAAPVAQDRDTSVGHHSTDTAAKNPTGWNSQPEWAKSSEERLPHSIIGTHGADHVTVTSRSHDLPAVEHMTNSEVSLTSSTQALVNADISTNSRSGRLRMVPLNTYYDQREVTTSIHSQMSRDSHKRLERVSGSLPMVAPAPLRLSNTIGLSRESVSPRPLSPLATSTLNATNVQSEAQGSDPEGGVPQPHPPRESGQQSSLASNSEHPPTVGGSSQLYMLASHSDVQLRSSQQRRGSGQHPSHQRQDSGSRQHRISQDLEVMNLAISGMDSSHTPGGVSFSQPVYSHSKTGTSEAKMARRSEHHSVARTQSASRKQQQPSYSRHPPSSSSIHTPPPSSHTPTSNNRAPPSNNRAPPRPGNSTTSSGIGSSTTNPMFRPITPAIAADGIRPSSAPNSRISDNSSPASRSTFSPNSSHVSSLLSRQQQHSSHPRGSGNPSHVESSRSTGQGRGYQPPQVAADSYDYLPPYSPPDIPQVAPVRSQQQQAGFAREAYPEPPPSYDEIFGGSPGSNRNGRGQQQRQARDSSSLGRVTNQSAQVESHHSSRQLGRLSSLTNLFRRSRKHTRSAGESAVNEVAAIDDDYTAQWVESYSHTPRPSNVMMNRQQNVVSPFSRTTSSPDPSSSHAHHPSPTSLRSPPIPYRSPPPLVPPGQHSPLLSGHGVGRTRGSLNLSMTRLPTDGHTRSQTNTGHSPVVHRSPRDQRPRPASAYLPQEYRTDPHGILHQLSFANIPTNAATPIFQANSTHSTPRLHSRLVSPSNMSASCSDITTNQVRKGENSPHPNLRHRGTAHHPPTSSQRQPSSRRPLSQGPPEDRTVSTAGATGDGLQLSRQHGVESLGQFTGPVAGKQQEIADPAAARQHGLTGPGQQRLTDPRQQGLTGPGQQRLTDPGQQGLTDLGQQGLTDPGQQGLTGPVVNRQDGDRRNRSSVPLSVALRSRDVATPSPVDHMTSGTGRASASPTLISNTSSPIPPPSASPLNHTTSAHQSHPGTPSSTIGHMTSVDPRGVSNASSSINIALSGSSALSQVMPEASSSNQNIASSNIRSSTNSPTESSASNSVSSSRAAARLRAETRRRPLISEHSSSDENLTRHPSSSHTHSRHKRRRSQGVGNPHVGSQRSEGQRSDESRNHVDGVVCVGQRSSVQGGVVSSHHGDEIQTRTPSRSRSPTEQVISSHESSSRDISRENPAVDVSGVDAAGCIVKSCGHKCESGKTGQVLCCLCSRKRSGPALPEEQCPTCARRRAGEEHSTIEHSTTIQYIKPSTSEHRPDHASSQDNPAHSSNPDHTSSDRTPSVHSRTRNNKNCVIM